MAVSEGETFHSDVSVQFSVASVFVFEGVLFFPLDDESYPDEDSAFGWTDNPEWDEIDPDAEIE